MNALTFRPGAVQAVLSLVAAVSVTAAIASASPISTEIGGRLAVAAFVCFILTLAYGSARFVGLSSIPMLSAALAASSSNDPAWVPAIVIGCLWYAAVELAWESIDRRSRGTPSVAVSQQRLNEVATVATLALAVTAAALTFASAAPQRTLLSQGPIIIGLFAAITFVARNLAGQNKGDATRRTRSRLLDSSTDGKRRSHAA
ncbi:MAG: hypothetical protein HKN94_11725 [Acidimicrobiales bacterium]|nr:hypothetical protein [Acidimicrobiales bacterium]